MALRGLFEMLAAEYANEPRLRINALVPPPARTRLRSTAYPAEDPRLLAEPEDIAPRFIELLGARTAALRGHILPIAAGKGWL